jgi:hypothetical protein
MALAGSMAGGIAGFLGNPAELIMVRMQADKAKPEGRECLYLSLPRYCFLSPELECQRIRLMIRTVQLQKLNSRSGSND